MAKLTSVQCHMIVQKSF